MQNLKNITFGGRQFRQFLLHTNCNAVALHQSTNIAQHHHPNNADESAALLWQFQQFRHYVTNPPQSTSSSPSSPQSSSVLQTDDDVPCLVEEEGENEDELTNDGDDEQIQRKTMVAAEDAPINWDEEEEQQEEEKEEEDISLEKDLVNKRIALDGKWRLQIRLKQGRTGHKSFQITKSNDGLTPYFKSVKILVPEDAYTFLQAIDSLIQALPPEPPLPPSKSADGEQHRQQQPIFARQKIGGKIYDYVLHIALGGPRSGIPGWQFCMRTVQTVTPHKPRQLSFPLSVMPWLRKCMAEGLAQHDGSQRIGRRPMFPAWAMRQEPPHRQNPEGQKHAQNNNMAQQQSMQPTLGQLQHSQQQQLEQLQAQIAQLANAISQQNNNQSNNMNSARFVPTGMAYAPPSSSPPPQQQFGMPQQQQGATTGVDMAVLMSQLINQMAQHTQQNNNTATAQQQHRQREAQKNRAAGNWSDRENQ